MSTKKCLFLGMISIAITCLSGMSSCGDKTPAQPPQGGYHMTFWETYEASELMPFLQQLNETDSLYAYLSPAVDMEGNPFRGPMLGYATAADTAMVNAIIASEAAKATPLQSCRYAWTVKPIDRAEEYFQLIALKPNLDGEPEMTGEVLTKISLKKEKWGACIDMEMNEEGTAHWQRFTRDNIGKSVAIVIDGRVYSYPIVQMEIESGKSQIAGNFTLEEMTDIVDMLNNDTKNINNN